MATTSAWIIMYRRVANGIEVFLVHHGGPFFRHRNNGSWSIPKGGLHFSELPHDAAKREFIEETGINIPGDASFMNLGFIKQKRGKTIYAWAWESTNGEVFKRALNSRWSGRFFLKKYAFPPK